MALRRNNIILYDKIQKRFKELFEVKKYRYDHCIETLSNEFMKATGTIQHILRMDLPSLEKAFNPKGVQRGKYKKTVP
jgi:hypothetical protein